VVSRIALAFFLGVTVTQTATGSISGTITDPGGGLIPGVAVTASLGTGRRIVTSDSQGRFRLDNLQPGRYELEARLAGFETQIDDDVRVTAGATVTWNRTLRIRGARSNESPSGPDPTPPSDAQPIYAVVLRDIFKTGVPERIVIEAASVEPVRPDREDWQTTLIGAPAELRTQLDAAENRRPVWLNAAALPAGAQLVPRATIGDVFRSAPKEDRYGGWETFRQKYGVPSYVALSRAIISNDGRDALVYFVHACGNVCGEGTLLWLRRIPADGPWMVRARRGFWVS